jgi:DNA modification methylase
MGGMTVEPTLSVIQADSRHLPLPDDSVDLVVMSPPYFGLRSYTDGGEHYDGQIGAEPTPQEYIDNLLAVTRECVRVLKPTGSLFVNLGDKYASHEGNRGGGGSLSSRSDAGRNAAPRGAGLTGGGMIRSKSLLLLPQRYAVRCLDELGLICRANIVWAKPNGLPESVTDRVRRSHEDWFHFTLSPRYYSAVDNIREPHAVDWRRKYPNGPGGQKRGNEGGGLSSTKQNPLGKLPGSVWTVATEPLRLPADLDVDHFAAFPTEWPFRIVRGWSPQRVCSACGEGRRPIAERLAPDGRERSTTAARDPSWQAINRADWQENVRRIITGEACACPDTSAPSTPGVVLDPFGGTGTTAHVAHALGRHGISVDGSADYCRIASHPEVIAKRAEKVTEKLGLTPPKRRRKAAPVVPLAAPYEQDSLFGEEAS